MPNNPMNEDLPIKQSKNGQELPFKHGNFLSNLIYNYRSPECDTKILVTLDKINQDEVLKHLGEKSNDLSDEAKK